MDAIAVERIDHCTLVVTDAAAARSFYGGLLGLHEIAPPREFDFPAIWYDLGNHYLHLLVKPDPDTPGPRHVCFHVRDVAATRRVLAARGVPFDETVTIAAADRCFVRDPAGNRIELLRWHRAYDPATDGRVSV